MVIYGRKSCTNIDIILVKESVKALLSPHYLSKVKNEEVIDNEESSNEIAKIPTYCVIFKARLNNNFFKQDAIDIVGEVMKELCPGAKVEYKTPDLAVIFEVMKGHCCLSVLPNYYGYKKYNLIELACNVSEPKRENDCNNDQEVQ